MYIMDSLAKLLKATSDPVRLLIIKILGLSSYGALELSYILGLKQNSLSHHLKLLSQADIIESRREGNSIYYRRAIYSGDFQSLVEDVLAETDRVALDTVQVENILMIQQEREQQSKEFFSKNALRFKEQQELIADYESYSGVAHKMLISRGKAFNKAIEVGPGTGEFLLKLSQSYEQITAVDVSRDMLAQAELFCSQQQLGNIEFIHGDQDSLSASHQNADAVIFNMVLHHVSNPAIEIRKAADLLKNDGLLLITDLSSHDQDWVRQSCGDLWLGFEETELKQWAMSCGLVPLQTTHVGLRNGFQIQCQLFTKSSSFNEE